MKLRQVKAPANLSPFSLRLALASSMTAQTTFERRSCRSALPIPVAAWIPALAAFATRPLLGTAFIAYRFGLGHAIDAEYISSIDNVTRKLMQAGMTAIAVAVSIVQATMPTLPAAIATKNRYFRRNDVCKLFEMVRGNQSPAR